jgi:hypothetical protein
LINDLEQVVWKTDLAGTMTAVEDQRDPKRTHTAAALGYAIEAEFGGMTGGGMSRERVF